MSSSGLVVSGGGATAVATGDLFALAARLRELHRAASEWQDRLRHVLAMEPTPAPTWTGAGVGGQVFRVARRIDDVERRSGRLAANLVAAAEGYGEAERRAELVAGVSGAGMAWLLGRLFPFLAFGALPGLAGGTTAWLLASLVTGTRPTDAPDVAAAWLRENPRLLTNPAVVQAVRVMVSSADDAAAGFLGIPLPMALALGDEGAGVLGATSSALGLLSLARPLGVLRETPVTVVPVGPPVRAVPPAGVSGLARRIPRVSAAGPQVRIERYGAPGKPAWVVYVGGTAAWSPVTGTEPWDATSNITAVAEQEAGSYRSVVDAMRRAGVGSTDPVVQVGHSQGGIVATQVAASAEFNTVALATFGSPVTHAGVPDTVQSVATRHTDDIVTALGGTAPEPSGVTHLVVRREAFADTEVPRGEILPAHGLDSYRVTADMIDASAEPRLAEFRARLSEVLGTGPGEATGWRGTRIGVPGETPEAHSGQTRSAEASPTGGAHGMPG